MGIKIDDTSSRRQTNISARVTTGNSPVEGGTQSQFSTQLKKQASKNMEEALHQMAKNVIQQGERLTDKVDISELKAYKRMISEFLEESIRNFAKFSKESFMDRRGRHRLYATVQKVNEDLEELTKEVLNSERDHLKIVGKIEDIRGLILDIIL